MVTVDQDPFYPHGDLDMGRLEGVHRSNPRGVEEGESVKDRRGTWGDPGAGRMQPLLPWHCRTPRGGRDVGGVKRKVIINID